MLDALNQIVDAVVTFVEFLMGLIDQAVIIVEQLTGSLKLVGTFSTFFPASVFGTILAIVTVAIVYKILELLP